MENELTKIECIILQIENELYKFQKEFNSYLYREEFECHQTDWEMIFKNSEYGYSLKLDISCAKSKCPDRIEVLERVYTENKDYIHKILEKNEEISKKLKINIDTRMMKTLSNIREFFSNIGGSKISFRSKPCWNLSDFLISMLIENDIQLYTLNYKHFLFLLYPKGLDKNLIQFKPF